MWYDRFNLWCNAQRRLKLTSVFNVQNPLSYFFRAVFDLLVARLWKFRPHDVVQDAQQSQPIFQPADRAYNCGYS